MPDQESVHHAQGDGKLASTVRVVAISPNDDERLQSSMARCDGRAQGTSLRGGCRGASHRKMVINYTKDGLPERSKRNIYRLLETVQRDGSKLSDERPNRCTKANNNNTLLAKKALQYRKMLRRAQDVDLSDPTFNVDEFVGIRWCKITS